VNYEIDRDEASPADPVTSDPLPLATVEAARDFAMSYRVDSRLNEIICGFDAPFYQAGLAGYSDVAMRMIARKHGCPFCMTEALLDRMVITPGKARGRADLAVIQDNVPGSEADHPIGGQIIGAQADEMAEAASELVGMGYDLIDVNLACPVKKIGRKFRGGHFLSHPKDAIEVLRAVREVVPAEIPTTVKLRCGASDDAESSEWFSMIFDALYDFGYSWATVHGRTVKQKYNGPSNWDILRDLVKRYPDRLILGSGDIYSAPDIFRMLSYTKVQGVSVARGCIGNPWIFREARMLMAGKIPNGPTLAEQREVLLEHFTICCAEHGEKQAGKLMRKFAIYFSRHHPESDAVKTAFIKVKTLDEWKGVITRYYEAGVVEEASCGSE